MIISMGFLEAIHVSLPVGKIHFPGITGNMIYLYTIIEIPLFRVTEVNPVKYLFPISPF